MLKYLALSIALLAPIGSISSMAAGQQRLSLFQQTESHGDWMAGCDNIGQCTAIGFPSRPAVSGSGETAYPAMGIRFELRPQEDDYPQVEFIPDFRPQPDGSIAKALSGRFYVNDLPSNFGHEFGPRFERTQVPVTESHDLIDLMLMGHAITGISHDDPANRILFGTEGFPDIWQSIHAVRATVKRSKTFRKSTEQLQIRSLVEGTHKLTADNMTAKNMIGNFSSYGCSANSPTARFRYYTSSELPVLFSLQCETHGLNPVTYWFSNTPHSVQLSTFPSRAFGDMEAARSISLPNARFNPETGTMQSMLYRCPERDCGERNIWGLTSNGWELLEHREMTKNWRLEPKDWIRTYVAENIDEALLR